MIGFYDGYELGYDDGKYDAIGDGPEEMAPFMLEMIVQAF